MTLKEFVSCIPEGKTVIKSDVYHDVDKMSRSQKFKCANTLQCISKERAMVRKEDNVYYYRSCVILRRSGARVFKKTTFETLFSIQNGKLILGKVTYLNLMELFHQYEWLQSSGVPHYVQVHGKRLLNDILTLKITNPEDYWKKRLKYSYPGVNIPWKLFRDYMTNEHFISIPDLRDGTTSVEQSLRVLIGAGIPYEHKYLINDAIQSALLLGEKINLQWSYRRLREEHQRQIEQLNRLELESKDRIPCSHIFDAAELPSNVRWLNTELDVYNEAIVMHHCLHSNYYSRISRDGYWAFSLELNGEKATLGIRKHGDDIIEDQCRGIYNSAITQDMRTLKDQVIKILQREYNRYLDSLPKFIK